MTRKRWLGTGLGVVLGIAAGKLLLHLATASRYGYFGDELYFLACGEHLDWGYVDQPPLVGLVAWLVRHTLGTSLLAIRSTSALAGALLVVLTGLLARELGGRAFAMGLAALASALAGVYLVTHYLFTMNAWEPLFWGACAYLVVRIIKTGDERLWLAFGLVVGLGLENKYSMGVWGLALVVGLLLSPERRALARPWIWAGGAVAFLVFLPNLVWNLQHGWPFFELMRNIRASGRDIPLAPVEYLARQAFNMSPANLPIWLAGLAWLIASARGRPFRPLGWAFVVTLVFFIAAKGKDYYLAPAYPPLFAAGAVALEGLTATRRSWRVPLVALQLLVLPFLPLALPVLTIDGLVAYQQRFGIALPASERSHTRVSLPHHFAWQFGWEDTVATVARVYHALSPEERARAGIFGNNYGQAGAIDLLGPRYGLPRAVGNHQSYWLWGPGERELDVIIVLGDRPEGLKRWCGDVQVAAERHHPLTAVWENGPVLVCRRPRMPLREIWPQIKNWG